MAAKKTSNTKAYQLNADEQKFIDAFRAVVSARQARKAHEAAVDSFEELVDDFKYADDEDDSFF